MESKPKFRTIKSRRNSPMLIVNEMYLYNFICKNTKSFRNIQMTKKQISLSL